METDARIAASLARVKDAIGAAEAQYGRAPGAVKLLAVSKTRPPAMIAAALAAGQTAFGESYVREAREKIEAIGDDKAEWHFIGPVQSNKTRHIASLFSWVHSVDRESVARRLSQQRSPELPALNVCIQINISAEKTKSGVAPADVGEILASAAALPGLKVRGLMAMPAPETEAARQRQAFAAVRRIFDAHSAAYDLDTLSIGMSGDFRAAIAEGATIIRLGTAIFGAREQPAGT